MNRHVPLLLLLLSLVGAATAQTPRTFTPVPNKVIVGYWHNWVDGNYVPLSGISTKFNVVNIAFPTTANGDGFTLEFTPAYDAAQFKADVRALQARGTPVLLSLGGEAGYISLTTPASKNTFVSRLRAIIDEYGFDGIDLDLEGRSMSDLGFNPDFTNPTTAASVNLIDAVRSLKTAYGSGFILTAAPETYYVQAAYGTYTGSAGAFMPILYALRNYLAYLHVQLYNTGSMYGLDGQVYNSATADFIVAMTEMLLRGFPVAGTGRTFPALRQDQVAIGLPACTLAAGSGYTPPATVLRALDYLTKGTPSGGTYATVGVYPNLRGMMTWSINWDRTGCNNPAKAYEFANTYWDYFLGTATPSVALTAPAPGSTYPAGASIELTAAVSNATASKVDFYNGTTLLGTDTSAPFAYTIASAPAGSYTLTAKATTGGGVLTSPAVSVTVNPPGCTAAPTVSLGTPTVSGNAPATVGLSATASVSCGSVSKVEFYQGTTKLGEDATAPYTFSWTNVAAGTYSVTARAYANGQTTTSAAVSATVNAPPGGSCTGVPAWDAAKIYTPAGQRVTYNGRLFENMYWTRGDTPKLPYVQGDPWKDLGLCEGGTCTPTAPAVSLAAPTVSGPAPATVSLSASATATCSNTIAKVEFFRGSTKLGEDATAPYTFSWTNVAAGTYSLTAKATDNTGLASTSAAVSVTVNPPGCTTAPTVSLATPTVSGNAPATVGLSATASVACGSVSKVEFYRGTTLLGTDTSSPFAYSWTNVAAGTYSLTAKAYANGQVTTSAAVSVTVNAGNGGPCAGVPAWSATQVYANPGNRVTHNGRLFENMYWTQNQTPKLPYVQGDPWKDLGPCGPARLAAEFAGASVEGPVGLAVAVFPNPAAQALTVELANLNGREVTLQLTNASGAVLRTVRFRPSEASLRAELPVEALTTGLYVLSAAQDGRRASKKFLKE